MTEKRELRSRLVIGQKRDGRREYDEDALDELVELCLRPGVSIARMAIEHDVNPNQLRKWIARYQQRQMAQAHRVQDSMVIDGVSIDVPPAHAQPVESPQSAFVPVVATPLASPLPLVPATAPITLSLHVRLSNGVELDLSAATIDELITVVQMFGRMPCSGSTKS